MGKEVVMVREFEVIKKFFDEKNVKGGKEFSRRLVRRL